MQQQRHNVKQIIADFKLLDANTDEYCMLQPLRDWMKLLLRYEFYSV
jgi:holliday junction DNA helicase RuvB